MGWYDKFNDWYVRAIPETGDGMGWKEPLVGSRRRWRRGLPGMALMLPLVVVGFAWSIHEGRHGQPGPDWGPAFEISAGLVAVFVLINWVRAWYYETTISFSRFGLIIGTGRGRTRIPVAKIRGVRRLEQDGFTVLAFDGARGERARVFVPRGTDEQVVAAIRATGIPCE